MTKFALENITVVKENATFAGPKFEQESATYVSNSN